MASMSADNISALTSTAAGTHEGAQSIRESQSKRAHFTIDPATDPLVVNGAAAVSKPFDTLKEGVVKEPDPAGEYTYHFCEEAGADYSGICVVRFQPKITQQYGRSFVHCHYRGWHYNYFNQYLPTPHHKDEDYSSRHDGCNLWDYHYTNIYRYTVRSASVNEDGSPALGPESDIDKATYEDKHDKEELLQEEAEFSDCAGYEALADAGHCHYGEKVCVEGEETRTIAGVPIHRSCWAWRQAYNCAPSPVDQCGSLRAQGCVQISSTCVDTQGGHCMRYRQLYRCPTGTHKGAVYKATSAKAPFCFTGNCQNVSYKANEELLAVLSHMAMLKEAQEDIRAQVGIFKGQTRMCTKNCVGFRDCCGVARGWGVSLGLAGCSGEEAELARWRGENKCVFVGTYCAEKLAGTGKCIRKKSSFCCFGTKLSRLVQEQGRRQLGMGWGSAEGPDCRGLRPDELGRLDFSRMDLRELYEEVRARFKAPTPEALQGRIDGEALKANMARLTAKGPSLGAAAAGGAARGQAGGGR